MSSDIKSCPQCQAIILDDTNVCPACDCQLEETIQVAQRKLESVDVKCGECGEMVAEGSVRCWNCSAFMQADIEIAMWQTKLNSIDVDSTPQGTFGDAASDPYAKSKPKPQASSDATSNADTTPKKVTAPATPPSDPPAKRNVAADKMARTDAFALDADRSKIDDDGDFELGPGVTMYDDPEPAASSSSTAESGTTSGTQSVDELDIPSLVDLDDLDASTGGVPEIAQTGKPEADAPPVQVPPVQVPPAQTPPIQSASDEEENEVSHSVATAGDLLLQIAMEEEAEFGSRSKPDIGELPPPAAPDQSIAESDQEQTGADTEEEANHSTQPSDTEPTGSDPKAKGTSRRATVTVTCSNGHTVKVSAKNRGRKGKCPKCKVAIAVPRDAPVDGSSAPAETWLRDIRLHSVKVDSVKLKPGTLARDFVPVDVRFSAEGLLVLRLNKKKGLFGNADKQATAIREAAAEHLQAGKPLKDLAGDEHLLINAGQAEKLRVVEPVVYEHESVFKAIPVFGEKQIAVQLNSDEGVTNFLSFGLTKFREFASTMSAHFAVSNMGLENGVPLADESNSFACHYSDESFQALTDSAFHRHDSDIALKVVGWRCESCDLIVSEDSRKKEKIGGLNGKSIAKAKCPKCEERFGDHPLHVISK